MKRKAATSGIYFLQWQLSPLFKNRYGICDDKGLVFPAIPHVTSAFSVDVKASVSTISIIIAIVPGSSDDINVFHIALDVILTLLQDILLSISSNNFGLRLDIYILSHNQFLLSYFTMYFFPFTIYIPFGSAPSWLVSTATLRPLRS